MEDQIKALKSLLGPLVYADVDTNLETVVGRLLKASGRTLSVAESCTGGEIAHLITTVSGSSAYFLGSVTSYARSVKEKVLGVPAELIDRCGIVSAEVAEAMAEGVRRLTGSDYAVATTGLADKDADERGVPGGTVWIGVASERVTRSFSCHYHNDRKRNIERFAASALNGLRLLLEEETK
jgi:nicotinamide-nucleotide amidase